MDRSVSEPLAWHPLDRSAGLCRRVAQRPRRANVPLRGLRGHLRQAGLRWHPRATIALEVLGEMRDVQLHPDGVTYVPRSPWYCWAKCAALELLGEARDAQSQPGSVTGVPRSPWNSWAKCATPSDNPTSAPNRLGIALELLGEMRDGQLQFDVVTLLE